MSVRKKARMGRPPLPKGTAKASMFCIRLSPSEREAIERAAAANDLTVSEWARKMLLANANTDEGVEHVDSDRHEA